MYPDETEESVAYDEPFARFGEFYAAAIANGMADPNAMTLATVAADGQPSTRTVLLKGYDATGFAFYTNLESRKGREIQAHPLVSLTFFWRELGRQAHVRGRAEAVRDEEADAYFATRPRGSQLGAWASRQSHPLKSREELLARLAEAEELFADEEVPRPPHWSGFRVIPLEIELWTAGEHRLHHRRLYRRAGDGWRVVTLFP